MAEVREELRQGNQRFIVDFKEQVLRDSRAAARDVDSWERLAAAQQCSISNLVGQSVVHKQFLDAQGGFVVCDGGAPTDAGRDASGAAPGSTEA